MNLIMLLFKRKEEKDPLYSVYEFLDKLAKQGDLEIYMRRKDGIYEGTLNTRDRLVEAWDGDDLFDVLDELVSRYKKESY